MMLTAHALAPALQVVDMPAAAVLSACDRHEAMAGGQRQAGNNNNICTLCVAAALNSLLGFILALLFTAFGDALLLCYHAAYVCMPSSAT
jgi:hypothetical protein